MTDDAQCRKYDGIDLNAEKSGLGRRLENFQRRTASSLASICRPAD